MTFIETIAVRSGQVIHPHYHTERMKYSAGVTHVDLQAIFDKTIPTPQHNTTYKLRLIYSQRGIHECTATPYAPRPVRAYTIVDIPASFDYSLKYEDRSLFDTVSNALPSGQMPILCQDGWVTDTTYTNLCFLGEDGKWVTPSTPLLKGTMRASLLDSGHIAEARIHKDDLGKYKTIAFINAMLPLGELTLPIQQITPYIKTKEA